MICLGGVINYLLREKLLQVIPVIVNIGEWSEGDEEDKQRALDKIKKTILIEL